MAAKKKRKTKASIARQNELIRFLVSIATIGFSVIGYFRYGIVGEIIDNTMRVVVGQYTFPYYILITGIAFVAMVKPKQFSRSISFWLGISLLMVSLILTVSLSFNQDLVGWPIIVDYFTSVPKIFMNYNQPAYGGIIGAILYGGLSFLVAREGVIVINFVFSISALALLFSPQQIVDTASKGTEKTSSFFGRRKEKREAKQLEKEAEKAATVEDMIAKNYDESDVRAGFMSLEDASSQQPSQHTGSSLFVTLDDDMQHEPIGNEDSVKVLDTPTSETREIVDSVTLPSSDATTLRENVKNDSDQRPLSYDNYRVPPVTLLETAKANNRSNANATSAKNKADRLINVLKQFGIEATLIDIHIGPAVTKFELKPDSNVKISKISSIQDNLMMELAVKTLRIEAPIPGKSAVGIEIPNVEMIPVKMKEVINQSPNFADKDNINVALGKDLMGKPITVALNKMPHLLVAGATGSGKSVCMNSIITSIILNKKPDELKLLLVDPKKVEFTPYMDIPHLIGPVISDPMQASMALKVIVDEMEERYDTFSKVGVRNIGSYNEKVKLHPEENRPFMPWIVVIIDELADLMAVAGKDVETSIQRITQLARAAGIHLIVATQRPSVDVVTGVIKANIPSRIAFAVSSSIDSRTILDTVGAEKLLGYGDMLYIPMGEPNPVRVQGVYVSDDEVRRIAEKASMQAKPQYDDAFIRLDGVEGNNGFVQSNEDPLYEEAYEFVVKEQRASTSLLQRRFKVGYNRAANLIDALEQNGIIGPSNGSKPRDVYKQASIETE